MTNQEANRLLVGKCMEHCCEILREGKTVPAKGSFRSYSVSFGFRGSKNQALFSLEYQYGDIRWLRFFVTREGYDLAVSNYMEKGTNAALIKYLSDKSRIDEFLVTFQHLSDSVDDKLD